MNKTRPLSRVFCSPQLELQAPTLRGLQAVAPNDATLEAPRRALDARAVVGLIRVIRSADPRGVIDMEPPARPEHRAPVDGGDAHGHKHHAEPAEKPGGSGAGALREADEEPAVALLEARHGERPAVAHHVVTTLMLAAIGLSYMTAPLLWR